MLSLNKYERKQLLVTLEIVMISRQNKDGTLATNTQTNSRTNNFLQFVMCDDFPAKKNELRKKTKKEF